MITGSPGLLSYINTSQSFKMTNGCTLEYNMNELIDGVTMRGPNGTATNPAGDLQVTKTDSFGNTYKPFEKLFPITSIIDPRRPKLAGIQYMIDGDRSVRANLESGIGSKQSYSSSASFSKRLYFSSLQLPYKYWVSPAVVLSATGDTTLTNCILTVEYPILKTAATNKIVVKFETSHSTPTEWTLTTTDKLGAETVIYNGTSAGIVNGVINLYYKGLPLWTTVEADLDTEKSIDIHKLKLQVKKISVPISTKPDTSTAPKLGFLGMVELSARYVIDVSDRVESFNISANSSDKVDGLVPVGDVTANSMRMSINAYDKAYENYDKVNSFNKNKINLYKNVIARPYVRVDMEIVKLGTFYIDSYSADEFGLVDIMSLDGAKELQYIKPPDIVTTDMSSVAIIRRLLDSVGFTNYIFNLADEDDSTITPFHWYTDKEKTVWQHIQDLCKDTQMIAIFDHNDVLQFYPRDKIFAKDNPINASFRYSSKINGTVTNLANISSLSIDNVPSVKAIKVLYSPQLSSSYLVNADNLYTSPVVTLGAAALTHDLDPVAPENWKPERPDLSNPQGVIKLEPVVISGYEKQFYSFTGYLVVEKEIIEYDAILYEFIKIGTKSETSPGIPEWKWVTSEADIQKYQGLAMPNSFKPTGVYRIKSRNVFEVVKPTDTESLTHKVKLDSLTTEWKAREWTHKAGTFGAEKPSLFTLDQVKVEKDEKGNLIKNKDNLLNSIPRSMMTIYAPLHTEKDSEDPSKPKIITPNEIYSIVTHDSPKFLGEVTADSNNSFAIGTNMYFPLLVDDVSQKATGNQKTISGIAFSLSADNTSGYLLTIGTSQNATVDKNYRDVNFYKIVAGKIVKMTTSQKESDGTIITNINGGELYRIDIKGNWSKPAGGTKKALALKISINNAVIAVLDTDPLTIVEKIGLLSLQGISAFDYVYTTSIAKEEFLAKDEYDLYKGFVGGTSSVIKTFGDFIFNKGETVSTVSWLKEFGPVARELRRIKARYTTPGFPRYAQLVNNDDVTIVGTALDPFTMDTFVLNNTGAFTSLANGEEKQFIVVGDFITPSDQFEYIDPDLTDEDKKEQVAFDSTWIQREDEAKSLAKWMTNQWSKQQKVLTLQTFINPLLQVGDVIQVSYPENKIYSTEDVGIPTGYSASKFVILSLDNTYDSASPPTTSIVCRSIYTG